MSERERKTDDGTYPNVGEEREKFRSRETIPIVFAGRSDDESWGAWHIRTAPKPDSIEPGVTLTFKRTGEVIFNGRTITTDGEIVAAMRTLAKIVIDCKHEDVTHIVDTQWCVHCGSLKINGEWRRPRGVRW